MNKRMGLVGMSAFVAVSALACAQGPVDEEARGTQTSAFTTLAPSAPVTYVAPVVVMPVGEPMPMLVPVDDPLPMPVGEPTPMPMPLGEPMPVELPPAPPAPGNMCCVGFFGDGEEASLKTRMDGLGCTSRVSIKSESPAVVVKGITDATATFGAPAAKCTTAKIVHRDHSGSSVLRPYATAAATMAETLKVPVELLSEGCALMNNIEETRLVLSDICRGWADKPLANDALRITGNQGIAVLDEAQQPMSFQLKRDCPALLAAKARSDLFSIAEIPACADFTGKSCFSPTTADNVQTTYPGRAVDGSSAGGPNTGMACMMDGLKGKYAAVLSCCFKKSVTDAERRGLRVTGEWVAGSSCGPSFNGPRVACKDILGLGCYYDYPGNARTAVCWDSERASRSFYCNPDGVYVVK